jgi:4-hydroxybenzoate polyprenyltransferase
VSQSPILRIARLVHPFPSFVNAGLVLGLSLLAGAPLSLTLVLALGMLGIQFCIGVVNDLEDASLDARSKPWKPIPSGLV